MRLDDVRPSSGRSTSARARLAKARFAPTTLASATLTIVALAAAGCEGGAPLGDAGPAGSGDGGVDAGPVVDCTARPADAPPTRGEMSGVYDAARGRILVYGGNVAAPVDCMPRYELVDELWAFHLDCASWERLSPSGGPGIRARHATALDTRRDRMLFFGGRTREGLGSYTNYDDVWAFDLATDTWTQLETSGTGPSPRSSAVAVYDEARDRLIVMGGNVSTSGLTLTGADDTHALDLATGEWTAIEGAGPSARLFHGGVILGEELIVFGGTPTFDGPFYADTWALDLRTDTWRLVNDGASVNAPTARFGAELYADAERGRVLMAMGHDFGPPTGPGNMNDVWALDVAAGTWAQLQPGDALTNPEAGFCSFPADFTTPQEGAPERRYSFVHAQSDAQAFVFGGKTDCGNINDVWTLDLASGAWSQLRPATGGEACNRSGRTGCTTLCF
jgi:hypothetical protein